MRSTVEAHPEKHRSAPTVDTGWTPARANARADALETRVAEWPAPARSGPTSPQEATDTREATEDPGARSPTSREAQAAAGHPLAILFEALLQILDREMGGPDELVRDRLGALKKGRRSGPGLVQAEETLVAEEADA